MERSGVGGWVTRRGHEAGILYAPVGGAGTYFDDEHRARDRTHDWMRRRAGKRTSSDMVMKLVGFTKKGSDVT